MDPREFKKKAEEDFGVIIKDLLLKDKGGIKILPKEWMELNNKGVKSEASLTLFSKGYKHAFFSIFSREIKKNIIEVNKEKMKDFFLGKSFKVDKKEGTYAISYKGIIIGGVEVKEGVAKPILNKGLKREIK